MEEIFQLFIDENLIEIIPKFNLVGGTLKTEFIMDSE